MESDHKHVMLNISASTIVKVVLVLFLCVLVFLVRDIILIVLTAIVIASSIEPATRWFMRFGVPRLPAVIIMYLIIAACIVVAFYYLFLPLFGETRAVLVSISNSGVGNDVLNPIKDNSFVNSQPVLQEITKNFSLHEVANQINNYLQNLSEGFWRTISVVFGGVISFILIVVLSFYLAVQDDGIGAFLKLVTPFRHRKYVQHLWQRSQIKIGRWMQGQLLLAVIVGVLVYLGLMILGIQHALLLAFLAAIFEIIPLFGPILSAIPGIVVAFLYGGWTPALLVTGLYIIIQQFENHLIYPLVVKKVVGVPAIVVILALIAGGKLAGFLGLILAVPMAAVLMEYLNDVQKDQKLMEEAAG
ncbi:AI-2E family transporter [Candidatus Parcubacteria bacterium]|nr:AI-2E family transporter [Candidatus Parcubacteria bacterium]